MPFHNFFVLLIPCTRFAYPQHITVDPEDCDATFEAGILYVVFKCKQIYDNFANKLLGKVTKSDLKKLKGETKKSSNVPELEPVDKDEEEENEDEASKEEEIKPKKMSIQRKRGKKPADVCIFDPYPSHGQISLQLK